MVNILQIPVSKQAALSLVPHINAHRRNQSVKPEPTSYKRFYFNGVAMNQWRLISIMCYNVLVNDLFKVFYYLYTAF